MKENILKQNKEEEKEVNDGSGTKLSSFLLSKGEENVTAFSKSEQHFPQSPRRARGRVIHQP